MNEKVTEKSSVSEMLEKLFLMGVGAAKLTKDAVQDVVDDLVKRGQLSREQGEKLLDKASEKAQEQSSAAVESMSEAYQDTLSAMGIATRGMVKELEHRIAVLEAKVYSEPARVEEPDLGFRVTRTEQEEPT